MCEAVVNGLLWGAANMVFRQGMLAGIFAPESDGSSARTVPPDEAARSRPVDPFDLSDQREEAQRVRLNLVRGGDSTLSGTGVEDRKKKHEEDERLMDMWFTSAILGRMTSAQWDAQMTRIGDTQMTNAQALAAFRKILDDPEKYKKMAIEKGICKEDEWDRLLRLIERRKELMELERRNGGILTDDQRREMKKIDNDPMMKKVGKVAELARSSSQRLDQEVAVTDRTEATLNSLERNEDNGAQRKELQNKIENENITTVTFRKAAAPTPEAGLSSPDRFNPQPTEDAPQPDRNTGMSGLGI